ncbi:MAG: LysM peptidoglycan-binding domain-containing protein, partial [Pseudomonadota bacterium]
MIRRDESDGNGSLGDPHEVWYRFGGRQLGYTGNNGTSDVDYATSIAERQARPVAVPGPFRGGSSYGASYADFAQSWDPINSYQQGSNGGSYTVRAGDTLGSIAAQLWGDSSLWYKLGEANGIAGAGALNEGQVLIVPSGVSKSTHNAGTFQPYDPAEALGDTSPTAPKPPKHNKCGVLGAVLLAAVAVAVTVLTRLPVAKFFAGVLGGSTTAGGIVGGVVTGAAASAASQGVGIVTGIQQGGFSWKSVALAAVSGGVGGGVGGDKLFGIKSGLLEGAVRGVVGNVLGQGIGLATGLQSKFDWAGVAAAGV